MEAQESQTVNSKEYDPTENDGMHRDLFERCSIVQAVLDLLCKQYWTGNSVESVAKPMRSGRCCCIEKQTV